MTDAPLPYAVLTWIRGIDVTARAVTYAVHLDTLPITDAIERVWDIDATSGGPTLAAGLAAELNSIADMLIEENPRGVDRPGEHDPGGLHGWLSDVIWQRQTEAAEAWLCEAQAIMGVKCVG